MLNLGVFMMAGALMMASGSLSSTSRSGRALVGLVLFGEGGVTFIGAVVGIFFAIGGLHYIRKKPSGDVV